MDIRINSITQVDMGKLTMPQIAVYRNPEGFPEECVARVFDTGKPTNVIMVKREIEEISKDIIENTKMVFVPRGAEDVLSLVGVWM